jgi:SEC-C motif
VRGGEVELVEKLGRNDPCPCGSGSRFQGLLPERRPLSTGRNGITIGGSEGRGWLEKTAAFLLAAWRSWREIIFFALRYAI